MRLPYQDHDFTYCYYTYLCSYYNMRLRRWLAGGAAFAVGFYIQTHERPALQRVMVPHYVMGLRRSGLGTRCFAYVVLS